MEASHDKTKYTHSRKKRSLKRDIDQYKVRGGSGCAEKCPRHWEKGESAAVVEYFVKDFLKMSFKTEQMSEKGLALRTIISNFNFVLLD